MFCIGCFGSRERASCAFPAAMRKLAVGLVFIYSLCSFFSHICIMLCGTQGEVCELPVHEPMLLKVNGSPALLIK